LTHYHDFFVERVNAGERVLDIGSGKGEVAFDLVTISGAVVVGIDHDPHHLAFARSRFDHPNLEFYEGDVLGWIPAGHFDVIVLSNVFEHLDGTHLLPVHARLYSYRLDTSLAHARARDRVLRGEHQTELAFEFGVNRKTIRRRLDALENTEREHAERAEKRRLHRQAKREKRKLLERERAFGVSPVRSMASSVAT
jgi:SAM-dependent methyltransferase